MDLIMRGVKDRKFGKNKKALNKTFHCYNLFLFIEEIIIHRTNISSQQEVGQK